MFKILILTACVGVAVCALEGLDADRNGQILRFESDSRPPGYYTYNFQTSNGIANGETGEGGKYANGYSQWRSPDGQPFELKYTADEFGFHPEGSHLPLAHPTPNYILRALEWIREHPDKEAQKYL